MPCQQTPSPQRVLLVLILILCRWNRGNLIVGNKFWPCTLWQTSSNRKFHEFISFSIDSIPISTNGGFAIAQVVSTTSFCKAWVSIHAKCQNPPYCFANSYALKTWMSVAKWLRILGSQPNKSKRFLPLKDSKILLFLVLQTIGILPESPHVTASEDLCSSRRSSCQATKIESSWPNKKGDLLDDPKNSQPPAEHSQLGPQRFLLDLCFCCSAFCWAALDSFCWEWLGYLYLGSNKGILKALHDFNISLWLTIFQISTSHLTQYDNIAESFEQMQFQWFILFAQKLWKGNSNGIQLHLQTIVWFSGDVTWLHTLTKWIALKNKTFTSIFKVSNWQRKKCMFSSHVFKIIVLCARWHTNPCTLRGTNCTRWSAYG